MVWEYLTWIASLLGTTPESMIIGFVTAGFLLFVFWLFYRTFTRANKDSQALIDAINSGDHNKARNMVGLKSKDPE
jgi:uncharacterized membrane protein YqiK